MNLFFTMINKYIYNFLMQYNSPPYDNYTAIAKILGVSHISQYKNATIYNVKCNGIFVCPNNVMCLCYQ